MNRWNRNVIEWNFRSLDLYTTLPVPDCRGKILQGTTQRLYGIRAVSLPERCGKIELAIYPSVNCLSRAGGLHIIERFDGLQKDRDVAIYGWSWGNTAWPMLSLKFRMNDGEAFCDTAIKMVKEILAKAGVEDERGYWLGNFVHRQATFIGFESGWVSYTRWLRMQNRLPLEYPSDDENVPLVEERDLA